MPKVQNSRKQGIEFRAPRAAAVYVARHPRTLGASTALGTALIEVGPTTTGLAMATTAAAGCALYRGAPRTWDATVGPAIAAWWRRWSRYQRRWTVAMNGCDLSKMDKASGELVQPRLKRVRVRGSWDVLYVKMLPGQTVDEYEDQAEALAGCWFSDRVAVQRVSSNRVALLVERSDPFGPGSAPIPASPIPESPELVDLSRVDAGSLESGDAFALGLLGSHLLLGGTTRSGKSGGIWNPLRSLGPLIRDRWVLVHAADLKGGAELDPGMPLFSSYARTGEGCLAMIRRVVELMDERKLKLRREGRRKFSPSADEPFHLLMIDELLVMTSLAESQVKLQFNKLLGKVLTQGAGLGFCVCAYVQDPTTEGVPFRRLFPTKIALRLDQDNHVDMLLGEGSREKGALADKIPANQQGTGYVAIDGVREPRRFRLGLNTDEDIADLVAACTPEDGIGPVIFDAPEAGGADLAIAS